MAADLPGYFFRTRENGATVFRIVTENRSQRLEMEQIAVVNVKNGEIRAQGERALTAEDKAAIRDWMEARIEVLAGRDIDDIHRTIDHLSQTAHWAQTKASADQLDAVTEALLLAMHDLRMVLVRKQAERLNRTDGSPDAG